MFTFFFGHFLYLNCYNNFRLLHFIAFFSLFVRISFSWFNILSSVDWSICECEERSKITKVKKTTGGNQMKYVRNVYTNYSRKNVVWKCFKENHFRWKKCWIYARALCLDDRMNGFYKQKNFQQFQQRSSVSFSLSLPHSHIFGCEPGINSKQLLKWKQ